MPQAVLLSLIISHSLIPCGRIDKTLGNRWHHCRITGINHRSSIARRNLDRGVQCRGRGSTYEQRNPHVSAFHKARHIAHLFKRRGDKPTQPDEVSILLDGTVYYFLSRHHHPEINHVKSIAVHDDIHDIFTNIMHVALHRGYNHFSR